MCDYRRTHALHDRFKWLKIGVCPWSAGSTPGHTSQMSPNELWTCPDDGADRAQAPGCQRSSCGSVRRGRGGDRYSQRRSYGEGWGSGNPRSPGLRNDPGPLDSPIWGQQDKATHTKDARCAHRRVWILRTCNCRHLQWLSAVFVCNDFQRCLSVTWQRFPSGSVVISIQSRITTIWTLQLPLSHFKLIVFTLLRPSALYHTHWWLECYLRWCECIYIIMVFSHLYNHGV